jgi:hypothetical protein
MSKMAKTPSKKASVTTEIVLGQAAQQITKAVAELNSAIESVNELTSKAEDLTLLVANKEEQIAALDTQFTEKERKLNVDLDLSFKASTERVVSEFLRASGKTAIPVAELTALQKELHDTKAGAEADVKRQVAIITSSMKSQHDNEIKLLHSENNTKAAENASKINVLADKNAFLADQNEKLYKQIDAERAASIERAKAGSVGSINVGDTSRK